MTLVIKDRVKETTTTTGTGSISLGGAVTKFITFSSVLSNADTTYYAIEHEGSDNEFEVGIGTYTSSGNTLTRTTILASSNSNTAVNFSAGTKNIFMTYPADKAVYEDASGNITIPGTIDGRDLATDGTKLDGIAASANNYSHPNHSGEVTSTADGATVIADNVVDEANLKVSNSPTNGYMLTAQSGNTGGLTWAAASGGSIGGTTGVDFNDNVRVRFGTGNDLQIYHTGAGSIIEDTGFGPLHFKGSTTIDFFASNGEYMAYMVENGAVGLYYDGSQKLNTTSSGIQTTGTVNVNNAYTLPTADGSANYVLTTNGSGVASWAAASGGGSSFTSIVENYSNGTAPSVTGNDSVGIGDNVTVSANDSYAIGHYATCAGAMSIALGLQANVTIGASQAVALGDNATVNAGTSGVALGTSYVSATDAFAAVISNNTSSYGATGANSIAIGQLSKATATNSIAIGDTATSTTANQIALGGTTDTVRISGTYTLPTADGSANYVLTTNGSGVASWAAASGGGGSPDLYAENYTTGTQPATTGTNAVAIGKGSSAAGTEAIAMVDGTADSQDSFAVGGIVQSALGGYAIGKSAQVYSQYGLALGQSALVSAASYGTAVGYQAVAGANSAVGLAKSRASGADSLAGAIANNTTSYGASGAGAVALMNYAKASGSSSGAFGFGANATNWGACALGAQTFATGDSSVSLGRNSLASATYSICIGNAGQNNIQSSIKFSGSQHANQGDAQIGLYPLMADTTDATATAMVTNHQSTPGAGTANQIVLPNNSAYAFHGTIVARQSAAQGTASAAWKIEGLIRREGSAGTTVLVNSATTVLDNTPSWGMALSADTTNGGLKVQVTGAASTNIRWITSITTSELTYA